MLGLEWNVRVSAARNPDAVAKMAAVFLSYRQSRDFTAYDAAEFAERTKRSASRLILLSPVEMSYARSRRPYSSTSSWRVIRVTIETCSSRPLVRVRR